MAICNNEFLRDPVGFMSTYAVAINYRDAGPAPNRFYFQKHGAGMPVVLEMAKPADGDVISAYWLPYRDNGTFSLQLGSRTSFLFTPPMTGCSFFIDRKWWSPTVAHINQQNGGGAIDQAAIDADATHILGPQTNQGGMFVTANYYAVRKDDYVPHGGNAQDHRIIVFGVRSKLGWYLYRTKHDIGNCVVSEAPTRIN